MFIVWIPKAKQSQGRGTHINEIISERNSEVAQSEVKLFYLIQNVLELICFVGILQVLIDVRRQICMNFNLVLCLGNKSIFVVCLVWF